MTWPSPIPKLAPMSNTDTETSAAMAAQLETAWNERDAALKRNATQAQAISGLGSRLDEARTERDEARALTKARVEELLDLHETIQVTNANTAIALSELGEQIRESGLLLAREREHSEMLQRSHTGLLHDRNQWTVRLNEVAAEADAARAELRALLDRDVVLADLRSQVARRDQQIVSLSNDLANVRGEVVAAHAEWNQRRNVADMKASLSALTHTVGVILASPAPEQFFPRLRAHNADALAVLERSP